MGLELWWSSFWDLDSERQVGFGVGRIPWIAIAEYAQAHDFDAEQVEDLFYFTKEMDDAFLKYQAKESKAKSKVK